MNCWREELNDDFIINAWLIHDMTWFSDILRFWKFIYAQLNKLIILRLKVIKGVLIFIRNTNLTMKPAKQEVRSFIDNGLMDGHETWDDLLRGEARSREYVHVIWALKCIKTSTPTDVGLFLCNASDFFFQQIFFPDDFKVFGLASWFLFSLIP